MFTLAIKWLVDSGVLEKMLKETETERETPLTAADVRQVLQGYIEKLMGRLDEDRLRQLGGGLTMLKDAVQSAARSSLATQALQSFHEIAALPRDGVTGGFSNRELICLAYLGMASAHGLLGDARSLIAEKIVQAVDASPETSERFLGTQTNNAIYRRFAPNQFFPSGGSPAQEEVLVPKNRRYFVAPNCAPYEHLWLQDCVGPITGAISYKVGLTHYSAQHLVFWTKPLAR
jgi:hypothetical protein